MKLYFNYTILISFFQLSTLFCTHEEIVDYNHNESLEHYLPKHAVYASVFGATPRYSFYLNYHRALTKQIAKLLDKQYTDELASYSRLSFEQQVDIFLNCGIQLGYLAENITSLLEMADTLRHPLHCKFHQSERYLIHILCPHYFADCYELHKKGALTDEQLYLFL